MLPLLKLFLSAGIIAGASELAKRSPALAALLISLPLTSLLSLCWVWIEGPDPARITTLSHSILAYTLPSLPFFLLLPLGLRLGLGFWPSLLLACLLTAGCYRLCDPLITRWAA
jgi:hypothetical protein